MIGFAVTLLLVTAAPGEELDGLPAPAVEIALARQAIIDEASEDPEYMLCDGAYNFDDGQLLVEAWCYGLGEEGPIFGYTSHTDGELTVTVNSFSPTTDAEALVIDAPEVAMVDPDELPPPESSSVSDNPPATVVVDG